jgi:hypothetical protein
MSRSAKLQVFASQQLLGVQKALFLSRYLEIEKSRRQQPKPLALLD